MTNKTKCSNTNLQLKKPQAGAVLVISLIVLLLLTLISMTSTQNTGLEEKMAGNSRDKNLAFQAAESALIVAEASLNVLPVFDGAGTNGFYSSAIDKAKALLICPVKAATVMATTSLSISDTSDCFTEAMGKDSFWATAANSHASGMNLAYISSQPRYVIQDLGCATAVCPGVHNYRITTRASGGSTNAVVILESIYQR